MGNTIEKRITETIRLIKNNKLTPSVPMRTREELIAIIHQEKLNILSGKDWEGKPICK